MRHPLNVIVYKAGFDDPISHFTIPTLLVCGFIFLNNAQVMTMADFFPENGFHADMGSDSPVEAVAIAAELRKGRSRTRAFPIHRVNRVHKAFTTGTIIISSLDPTNR